MNVAFCTEDEVEYDALAFSRLSAADLANKRRHLTCIGDGCGGRAYYRRRSSAGAAACFASNEHAPDCVFGASTTTVTPSGQPYPEAELLNPGDRLELELDPNAIEGVHGSPDDARPDRSSPRHVNYEYADGVRRAVSHRKLRPVLRDLIRSEAFRRSSPEVIVHGFPRRPVKEFFLAFGEIDPNFHGGTRRGFWGTVVDARQHSASEPLWLNSGTPDDPSVMILPQHAPKFLEANCVDNPDDLAGAWVLALGRYVQGQSGKRLIRVDSPAMLALILTEA